MKFRWCVKLILIILPVIGSADVLTSFIDQQDYLGLRVYLKKQLAGSLKPSDWSRIQYFILQHPSEVGYDLLYAWERRIPRTTKTSRSQAVANALDRADALMLQKNFTRALSLYQRVARALKSEMAVKDPQTALSAERSYPYVLEEIGRCLYALKRFDEAYEVFSWIPPSFPRYRRVLFEQMWASFMAGRIELTIGRLASQFSPFFTPYHYPDAYLMEVYVYKKLCRDADLKVTLQRMKQLRDEVISGHFTWRDWMQSDVEGIVLRKILESSPRTAVNLVTAQERAQERAYIQTALERAFQKDRTKWLQNMELATAFAELSTIKSTALKPLAKLPSRQELYRQKLEIWPVDKREEWIDEMGSHRFAGESQCAPDQK